MPPHTPESFATTPHLQLAAQLEAVHDTWLRCAVRAGDARSLREVREISTALKEYQQHGSGVRFPGIDDPRQRPLGKVTLAGLEWYEAYLETQIARMEAIHEAFWYREAAPRVSGHQGAANEGLSGLFDSDDEDEVEEGEVGGPSARLRQPAPPTTPAASATVSPFANPGLTRTPGRAVPVPSWLSPSRQPRTPSNLSISTSVPHSVPATPSPSWPHSTAAMLDAYPETPRRGDQEPLFLPLPDSPSSLPSSPPPAIPLPATPQPSTPRRIRTLPSTPRTPISPARWRLGGSSHASSSLPESPRANSPGPVRLDIDTILSEYFPPPEDADIWTPEKGRPSFELYKYADNEREVPREVLRSQLVTCRYCAQILAACHGIEGVVALCKVLVDALQPQPESDPE